MDTFGLYAKGTIILEKVKSRSPWTFRDIGRLIYELSTDTIWIGGTTNDDGVNGWFQIGLTKKSINSYHVDWDTDLTFLSNKISAVNIPCLFDGSKTNVQESLNNLLSDLNILKDGSTLIDKSIKSRHIDLETDEGLDASLIRILNENNYFKVTNVELALNYCYELTKDPLLPDGSQFGKLLGVDVKTVNTALIELEKVLDDFKAVDISASYLLSPEPTNVQFVLDALYKYISEVEELSKMTHNITNIKGVPDTFGKQNQILVSNGADGYCLSNLTAEIVIGRYSTKDMTIQLAMDTIYVDISSIHETLDIILEDNIQIKIELNEVLCQIESVLEKMTTISVTICELWKAIETFLDQINTIWIQIDLIWDNICRLWEEIRKIWEYIKVIEDCCNRKKIYFSVMKCSTNWQYGWLKSRSDYAAYPPMWLYCDFTNWYEDYKEKYDPNIGTNFIVVPIVQFQSFLIPNAFQCKGYITNGGGENPRNPMWPNYPPLTDANPTVWIGREDLEGGTLGEYPYVLYRGGLGGPLSDNAFRSLAIHSKPYYDSSNNWKFYIDIGTVACDNNRNLLAYSAGSRIDYVIYFFGFGIGDSGILELNSDFNISAKNINKIEYAIYKMMQSSIINEL